MTRKTKLSSVRIPDQSQPRQKLQKDRTERNLSKKFQLKKLYQAFLAAFILLIVAVLAIRLVVPKSRIMKDRRLNVLLITLDTTRADRLGCYGYKRAKTPNLDALAAEGVQFLNAYCQVPLTTPSHSSILSGMYPLYHRVRNNGLYVLPPEVLTLAEVLKDQNFRTAAFVGSFTVDSRFGLDQGFAVYDDQFIPGQAFKALSSERKADKVFEAFNRWLNENSAQPFFCWVHFYDPHFPYNPPAPFHDEFSGNLYDGEIAYTDSYVGQVVRVLGEKNLLSQTLIVLAGDHGEAFGEKVETGHGVFLYDGTMKVPLIFYARNHLPSGLAVSSRVRLIDLMPSILDMLDIPIPPGLQGASLLPFIRERKKGDLSSYMESHFARENYGWSELVGLVDGDWKFIKAPREELYNLRTDPAEVKNEIASLADIAQEKRRKLEDVIMKYSSRIQSAKRELTAEEKERLRSLGYAAGSPEIPGGPLPDPKDRVEELRLNQQAERFELEGNFAEAAKVCKQILLLRPEMPSSYSNLASMQVRMGLLEESIRTLEQGNARIPGSESLLDGLAHAEMAAGRLQKALDAWQAVLVLNQRHFNALLGSGYILDSLGKIEEAQRLYEKAMEIEPENTFLRKNYALNLARNGKINEAIDIYERLRLDIPDDFEVFQNLGIAYGTAGDLSKAVENLKIAVGLHPTPIAYYNLAFALKSAGSIRDAVDYLKLYLGNPEGEDEDSIRAAKQELANLEKILRK